MMKKFVFVVALFAALAMASPTQAATLIDFNMDAIHPAAATISYAGGMAPMVAQFVGVDTVTGIGGGVNSGVVLAITDGILTFTTGNYIGTAGGKANFAGGGEIVITGGIAALGVLPGSELLRGTFTEASLTNIGGDAKIAGGRFLDTKNPALLAFFGFPTIPFYVGHINLMFNATGFPDAPFTATARRGEVLSGDVQNTAVPEPGSMVLLGTGLFGLAGAVRRRLKK